MEFATREVRAANPITDHVIIVGYGLNGRNLARALRRARIPYLILDSNGALVRQARLAREPIFFGDGTRRGADRGAWARASSSSPSHRCGRRGGAPPQS
jgi:voltage-gated potassium channel Kch